MNTENIWNFAEIFRASPNFIRFIRLLQIQKTAWNFNYLIVWTQSLSDTFEFLNFFKADYQDAKEHTSFLSCCSITICLCFSANSRFDFETICWNCSSVIWGFSSHSWKQIYMHAHQGTKDACAHIKTRKDTCMRIKVRKHTCVCIKARKHTCRCIKARKHTCAHIKARKHTCARIKARKHACARKKAIHASA